MEGLASPFGIVRIKVNGVNEKYSFKELSKTQSYTNDPDREGSPGTGYFYNVDGRYQIKPRLREDIKLPVEIECYIELTNNVVLDDRTGNEGGEHMVMWSMYNENIKLSIGGFDDMPDYMDDSIKGYYTPTGVGIDIANVKYLEYAYFCIAWVSLTGNDHETNEDIYTWRAADPFC